jgi:PIN domain nuclease of toxin-antitoxin system
LILLDTCILIFDALTPERLRAPAANALDRGEAEKAVACADINLWETATLVSGGRVGPGVDTSAFCRLLDARGIRLLPISPEIAAQSARIDPPHGNPPDRLIGATPSILGGTLATVDERLRSRGAVEMLW